jgi:RimJ/RimL family protein N-acetyltransferase
VLQRFPRHPALRQWCEVPVRLREALDGDLEALVAGRAPDALRLPPGNVESPEVLGMLRDLAETIRPQFAPACWMMVEAGEIVGLCSLVKPPADGGIEIGYGVAASRRQRGLATAAVAALVEWARCDARVHVVRAETSLDNPPSQAVLERNGFQRVGARLDAEDGELICWSVRPGP